MIDLIKRRGLHPITKKEIFYPAWKKNQDVNSIQLAKQIARIGSLSAGVTTAVMLDFPEFVGDGLLQGNEINVMGLGSFKLKVQGKAKSKKEDVTVTGLKITVEYEPEPDLISRIRNNAQFRFVNNDSKTIDSSTTIDASTDYILDDETVDTSTNETPATIDTSTADPSTNNQPGGMD